MTYTEVVAALEAHAAAWPGISSTPIDFDNIQNPGRTSNFIRMTVLPGNTITAEVGRNPIDRKTGLVMFQVFTAEDKGWEPAYGVVDSLGAHMAYQSLGDVDTLAATPIRVGNENGYYQINLQVPYRC